MSAGDTWRLQSRSISAPSSSVDSFVERPAEGPRLGFSEAVV
jgi:hypothetical protein